MKELEQAKEDLQLASYAQQVVNNPAYRQAMMILRAEHIDQFTKASHDDIDLLTEIKRSMNNVEKLQRVFEKLMQDGRIAEHKINKLDRK